MWQSWSDEVCQTNLREIYKGSAKLYQSNDPKVTFLYIFCNMDVRLCGFFPIQVPDMIVAEVGESEKYFALELKGKGN